MRYLFGNCALDTDRRELRRGAELVAVSPQVFDLLEYLIRNREHVVSKEELIEAIWKGRIVSESALTTRLNAARSAIGDTGGKKRQGAPLAAQADRLRIKSHRKVFCGPEGYREMPVYDGSALGGGAQFDGPALIEQPTTTILILAGQKAAIDTYGNVLIDTMPGNRS